jgi:hypothetical protein
MAHNRHDNERTDDDDESADYEHICNMANRLKLTGRAKDKYVFDHMMGLGYQMIPTYRKPRRIDDDDDPSGFFTPGKLTRKDDDGYPF